MKLSLSLLALGLTTTVSLGQISPVAFETFEYTYPGLLMNANGGTGWSNPWFVEGNGNEVVIFQNNGSHPPFTDDGLGEFAGQAMEWFGAFRIPDNGPHGDVVENGKFGKDGATIWVGFMTRTYQQFGDHYGGVSLFDQASGEQFFIGTPWASYGWGVDDQSGNGGVIIAGSDDSLDAHIVVRIDYLAGQERVRMYLNPGTDHPTGVADLDLMVPDHRWDQVRMSSGGSASHQYWDRLMIDKGAPGGGAVGQNYCGPANLNSSGLSGVISGSGSDVVAANDVTLHGDQLALNQFSFFVNSMSPGFFTPPGSQGNLCLSGSIGRYNASVLNTGAAGTVSLLLDLTNTPTPAGPVAIQAGETWYFQLWFRDQNPTSTSNFTDGLQVQFQ